ncbi:hypothetical protein N4T77_20150, partial [Clostridium sp. CX1]|uniref:hypothetical protein n=1 Tax=Clostridium sp. CX1 TaxID=2978346 RepID=UPI0021BF4150
NLVENADFSYSLTDPFPWRQNPESDSGDKLASTVDRKTAYKIVGVVGKKKNISQEFNISGKAGDSFIVSGWAKGSSVALSEESVPDEEARRFALGVGLEK